MIGRLPKRKVCIRLDKGPLLEGIFDGMKAGHYVLLDPRAVQDNGESVPITGPAYVPAERVLFLQGAA